MKKLFSLIALFGIATGLMAQVDRSKMPESGPAPEIKFGTYESFEMKNGLKVFVVENHKLPRVSWSLILDRDPIAEGDKAGYTQIFGDLMTRGTANYTKAELDEEVDFIGARLSASSTSVSASSLSDHSETMIRLMAEVIMNPTFPEEEFEKIKAQYLSGIQGSKDNPDEIMANVSAALMYGKAHPYGEMITEETLENITVQDCKDYYNSFYRPNIGYLAIVGDINVKQAKKLVKKYLKNWEMAEVPSFQYERPVDPETYVAFVNRDNSVQSVINVVQTIDLPPGHEDVAKVALLNMVYGNGFDNRLYLNLREDKGYTYTPYASYDTDELVGSMVSAASVRNEVTGASVKEIMYELERLTTEEVSDSELNSAKQFITGSFARSMESASTVARFALNIARYNLPADYYENYLKRVSEITPADLLEAAPKYFHPANSHIVIVGKYDEANEGLDAFGEIKFFDIEANPTEEPSIPLPDGISAQDVINSYVTALGGEEFLATIKDYSSSYEMDIQGNVISMNMSHLAPNMSAQTMAMGSMEVFKMVCDGEQVAMTQQGMTQNAEGDDLKDMLVGSHMFEEMHWDELGVTYELLAIKRMDDGSKAYELKVIMPSGSESFNYYDIESGLKVRESEIAEGPQGPMSQSTDFMDYSDEAGLMIPTKIVIPLGPQRLEATLKEAKVNTGLKASDFAIK